MQMVGQGSSGSIARKLKRKLQRMKSQRVSRDSSCSSSWSSSSSSSSLGSDWLQRTSGSSWELFSSDDPDSQGESDDEELYLPKDVPEGFLAVYVGEERKRFVVDARHLSHPWFKILLERSAEEFGFDHKGGLTLPCRVPVFESLLQLLADQQHQHQPSLKQLAQMEQLLKFY